MTDRSNSRLVYSTGTAACGKCGWPANDCRCSRQEEAETPLPARITARLRMEKAGRGGKTVTVVDGLPPKDTFLKELCAELKRACGTGGAVKDGTIELQGEHRDRLRELLARKHFIVKG